MDMLKKFFPYSFKEKKDVTALVINVIMYIVVGFIANLVLGLIGIIPVIGIITDIVGAIVGLYTLIGLVLSVLDYFKVLK